MNAAVRAVWMNKSLWLLHVVANAALLAGIYGWLSIPDRSIPDLMFSAIAALAILVLTSWLHAGTLEYFRMSHETGEASVRSSFSPSFRRIGVFALWLILLCAAVFLVLQLRGQVGPLSNWLASAATLRLRRPVQPASIAAVLSALLTVVAFVVIPFLLLQWWKWKWSWTYLVTYAVLFGAAAYLPYQLVWRVPKLGGLYVQAASMVVRFSLAYLLAVTGWLVLASTLGQVRSVREVQIRR